MELIHLFTISPRSKKYYFDTDTLLGKKNQVSIHVSPVNNYSEKYHPARITYTGITIGGVHTGSINVQDEHFTYSTSRTGKGKISIDGDTPYTIILSDVLLEIAKKDPVIRNKLTGNELRLRDEGMSVSEAELMNMMRGNNPTGATRFVNSQNDACYSMEYCTRVADFLANALDGRFLTEEQRQNAASILLENNKPECILVGELLAGYHNSKTKELLQTAIDTLLRRENADYWYLVKKYLEIHSSESAKEIIDSIDKRLSTQNKYEIDGKIFYDKKKYDAYVFEKELEHKRKIENIKSNLLAALVLIIIGACGLIVLFALGII